MERKAIVVFIALILTCLPFYLLPRAAQASPTPTFYVDPSSFIDSSLTPGNSFTVNVNVSDAVDLFCWQVSMIWNPNEINVTGFVYGDFLARQPQGTYNASRLENGIGWLLLAETTAGNYPGVNGDGWLCSIVFYVKALGETTIDINSGYGAGFQTEYIDSALNVIGDQPGELVKQNGYFSNLGGVEVDTTPPIANAGPDQTVYEDATVTFDGTDSSDNVGIVSYVWTFIDITPQTLTGVNPTYTFTTAGVYTVTLDVSDAAGNHATDTVTITVLSLTPEELTQKLVGTIDSWNLPSGTKNSLTLKLQATLDLLGRGNTVGAVQKLTDFLAQVQAFRGKKLTSEQADYLMSEAQRIIDLIQG